jgi:putative DNA primase/helicase
MDLERKGQQSYQARLYVRFLCFGNGALRSLYDHSEGFYRRQMVIKTKERPKTRVDDPYLSEKLREEKQGILLWCINGLVRLIAMNFQFSQGATRVEQAQELKEDGNNIPQFLASQGYITFRENSTITSKELYRIYSIWCSDNDLPKRSSQSLSSELIQNRGKYHLTYSQRVRNNYGKFVRGFIGIGIAEDDEAESPPENRTLKELL